MAKKVVHYNSIHVFGIGYAALAFLAEDHPNHHPEHDIKSRQIQTSAVVRIDGTDVETLNTIYRKAESPNAN